MLVELISTNNADGVRLDGAFYSPPVDAIPIGPVDAVLLVHGSRGNFCDPTTKEMAEDLRKVGYACLTLNTTAHDTVWANASDGTYRGNAFEILDRTCLDLKAGIDYLYDAGYRYIALLGHSMGAVRVTYYAATRSDPRVCAVIPVSPVRLSFSYYQKSADAQEFQDTVNQAEALVAAGKGHELLDTGFPIRQLFSAASYLDKHGPAERYNLVNLASDIDIPLLAIAGSLETHTRLQDMARDLAQAAVNSPKAEYAIVEGGDHSLANKKREASTNVLRWLSSLATQPIGV
jgi:alpha-beta hydrolase superfamily lysophospholipase